MELQKQCVSLELAKKMKELGFKQESYFYWHGDAHRENYTIEHYGDVSKYPGSMFSAYTVAELGEMLPTELEVENPLTGKKEKRGMGFLADDIIKQVNNFYGVEKYRLFILEIGKFQSQQRTEADARAKMLIYLKE